MSKGLRILTIEDAKEEEILREKSLPVKVEEIKSKDFKEFLNSLLETAKGSKHPAGGIASSQVGILKRVFYLLNYDTDKWEVFINPTVEPIGYTKKAIPEECLSVPHREEKVLRYYKVKVRYLDKNGKKKIKKFEDLNAITIQHEYDHLEGILFIDKILEE
ncbi:MAG: peptide deformylase [Candidatus Dojkabacteria bacterium]